MFFENKNNSLCSKFQACWVLNRFSEIKFQQEQLLVNAITLTTQVLLHDKELPVKVEAAIALQTLLNAQPNAQKYIEPHVKEITFELLGLIRETENEDLTVVMQKIVCLYTDQLMPVAVEICQDLVRDNLN